MGYSLFIWSCASFIESRIKTDIEYEDLEKTTGFSYRHIRETFKECTGVSLSRYILNRRITNSAFDIVHTTKKLTDIAYDYKFGSYDSFTRAFKRYTGITPSKFREGGFKVGRRRMLAGFYAPMIYEKEDMTFLHPRISEDESMSKDVKRSENSCILYGVPRVAYSFEECTPFPVALKACLNYMGQEIDYTYIMAVSGASFRLRWNTEYWDGGNVDIMYIYEDGYEAFKRSFKAVGRDYKILKRQDATKEDFKKFIVKEINEGRPVIALGIIGPPEACLITGYKENGDVLFGWNCFQDNMEFAKGVTYDECGYFICDNWWENPDTQALMSIGENEHHMITQKEIIENAIDIMTKEYIEGISHNGQTNKLAGGQRAYDKWAEAISDDSEFGENTIIPILIERLVCQGDAQTMIGEGRSYAACFIEWVGRTNKEVESLCIEAAMYFRAEAQCSFDMVKLRGGFEQNESTVKKFAESEVRKETAKLILKAKEHDYKACELLKQIYKKI
jgi:AraC-like DNA-binding protein